VGMLSHVHTHTHMNMCTRVGAFIGTPQFIVKQHAD